MTIMTLYLFIQFSQCLFTQSYTYTYNSFHFLLDL